MTAVAAFIVLIEVPSGNVESVAFDGYGVTLVTAGVRNTVGV